jgi:hypothetical protein
MMRAIEYALTEQIMHEIGGQSNPDPDRRVEAFEGVASRPGGANNLGLVYQVFA